MKPLILLTGKNGQVGGDLLQFLPQLGKVVALARGQMDLSSPDDIRRTIREVQPQLIVNAAAYTAVDQAETSETKARAINAEAPGLMAEEAKKIGAALIHYSTDYVFNGSKKTPYDENDLPNPINVYGKSKLEGEEAIQNAGIPYLIFRTAWVYAAHGRNFLLTILRLGTEREELRIVCDQIGAPTWSREIASATTRLLSPIVKRSSSTLSFSGVSGTYHMTAAGETTWYDFAGAILEQAAHIPRNVSWFAEATGGKPLITRRVIPIAAAEYPTPASRPAYSVLSNSRLIRTFGFGLPDWRAQLQRLFSLEREVRQATDAETVAESQGKTPRRVP